MPRRPPRRASAAAPALLVLALRSAGAAAAANAVASVPPRPASSVARVLSGDDSGDAAYDDDFWAYDDGASAVRWDDYAVQPTTCLVRNGRHVIAFDLYGKGHRQCARRRAGTYLMAAGGFARAYVAQQRVDARLAGEEDYDAPEALDYLACTAVAYNDVDYYAKFGCSSQGGLKVVSYSDEDCSQEVSTNIGLYNDIKIQFDVCQACVAWPVAADDDAAAAADVDDNFDAYHAYDSKLCGAAAAYQESCGWGCRKQVKRAVKGASAGGGSARRGWGGFEKFCLLLWSGVAVALVWVVLKQRRLMTREDAIVEEAAMNGVGLRKRHVFPLAVGIVVLVLLAALLAWKRLTWLLLLGTNLGLLAHFAFLRRRARQAGGAGGDGYVKDAGLEIS